MMTSNELADIYLSFQSDSKTGVSNYTTRLTQPNTIEMLADLSLMQEDTTKSIIDFIYSNEVKKCTTEKENKKTK